MAKVVEAETFGFWLLLAKLFGPVQLKVVPMSVVPVRFSGAPTQTGELLLAEALGVWFFTNAKAAVMDVPKPEQVTATCTSHVPTGIVAVLWVTAVPSRFAVGLPGGP